MIKVLSNKFNALIKLVFAILRKPFYTSEYSITSGYIHRKKNYHFDDTSNKDEYQKEIYDTAKQIAEENIK